MAATVVPSANTTLEVLNLYNYEDWSIRVKTYLIAEGLWDDVVESTAETPRESHFAHFSKATAETEKCRMKNAKALHAIQNYCRTDVFGFIRDISTAKDAWETLAKRLKPKNKDIEGMAACTLVPSVTINLEALGQNNYKHWSFWVKRYLLAEDLWDIVEGTNEPPKLEDEEGKDEFMAWGKNNARALHVITIFCRENAESSISGIKRAKDAWNTLARKFGPTESLVTSEKNFEVEVEIDSNDDTHSNDGNAAFEIVADEASDYETYKPFFRNVWDQKWNDVKEFIKQHPEAVRKQTQYGRFTALQIAVLWENMDGVKELLPFMKKKDLEIPARDEVTALSLAIENTDTENATEIVKCIVEKNKKLLLRVVDPSANTIPLLNALSLDKPKMARYLYSVTPIEKLKSRDAAELISTGLRVKRLDIPLNLMRRFPNLVIAKDHSGESPLNELASTRAGLFSNASQLGIWKRLIYTCIYIPPTGDVSTAVPNEEKDQGNRKHLIRRVTCFFGRLVANLRHLPGIDGIYQMKLLRVRTIEILKGMCAGLEKDNLNYLQHKFVVKALFQAVERGHAPVIKDIMFQSQMWSNRDNRRSLLAFTNEHGKTVFQFAAEHRQEQIFDMLFYLPKGEIKEIVGRKDKFGNNMLHVAGKLSPLTNIDHIRGPALQMQYELQWFKKVERMASPKDLNCINSDGRTPHEEFTMNHRNLVEAGEKSMKETATSSSTLVAALIITIMFAAAVTVPGGIKGETGIPTYLHTKAFRIFIVADIISLCSSTTSVMIFLGILTSRFAEEDFLTTLPTKLIIGFLSLFLSIGAMMIAFSSAIFIMLPENPSIVILSSILATFPIASFLLMQFPFLYEIIISTFRSSVLVWWARRLKRWARRIN